MTAAPWPMPAPIFGIAAPTYLRYGWTAPLYVPVRDKTPPPDGFTGENGRYPTQQEVMNWVGMFPSYNIALRMPDDIIGIDIDTYEGKLGGRTIASLEAQLGPLPPTWITTSREDGTGSGIRLYKVPAGGQWKSNIQPHVEIVRRGHRYAMVAPSIHPNGGTYRWYQPGWVLSLVPPRTGELTDLPISWVRFLTHTRDIWAAGNDAQVRALTDRLIDPDGQPCSWLEKVTQSWVNKIKAAGAHCHDVGCQAAWAIACDGAKYHRGAFTSMARIREAWMQTRVPSVGSAETDWDGRSGAIEPTAWAKAATLGFDQVFEACRCWSGEVSPAGNAPAVNALQLPQGRRVELTAASSIKPKRALWLWAGRIPLGELSLLAGREGIGKSTVCYQIASDVTRGKLPGEFQGQGRPVIVIATEDSWEHTIVPRLMAAGADLTQVYRAEVITSDNIVTGLSLPADTEKLKEQINQTGTAMVLLDPLISRLDTKLDTHKDADVRVALEPLVQLAHDCSVAVLGLIHVNKSGTTDPLNSVMGSKAFAAVARSVLYCLVDPEDETEQRRLLGMPKNNLGRTDLPTLAFEITNTYVCESENGSIYTGRIEWTGEVQRGLRDLIETGQGDSESRTAVSEAAAWLSDFLSGQEGGTLQGCRSIDAKKEGAKAGHSKAAISRAAKRLPIVIKSEGFPRQTVWRLMTNEEQGLTDSSDLSNPAMADKSTPPVVSETPWRL